MTPEERIKALEMAIDEAQMFHKHYLGRCVNSSLHPYAVHPHWDTEWLRERGLWIGIEEAGGQ